MKDWPEEWILNKVTISKKEAEVGPSKRSTNPTSNIRKPPEHAKETRGSAIVRNPIWKSTIPNPSSQEKKMEDKINIQVPIC
jgi:hypothetical protein